MKKSEPGLARKGLGTGGVVLVLDAGTGGGRVMAVSESGAIVARSYQPWGYFEPEGSEFYGREFDPLEFRNILAARCREVVGTLGKVPIKGVTTTGMRQGCLFLDGQGKPLYGGPNRDVRGLIYTEEVEELLGGKKAYEITGHWPPWIFAPCRLQWFRERAPDLAARIGKIVMINDWLVHWLAGEAFSEPTNACESMLFDVAAREWSPELLEAMDLDPGIVPESRPCGSIVGETTGAASGASGIPEGTPVILGMADTQAAVLAAGATEPGTAAIVAGSTAPVMMVSDSPLLDPEARLWIGCHPLEDRWVIESNAGDVGLSYRGYVEGHLGFLGGNKDDLYERVAKLAADLEVGSMGARSYLGPVIWDLARMSPQARAGISFTFPAEEMNAGPAAVARAMLESSAFAIRANLEQAAALAGPPRSVVMAGGLTRTPAFNRIVASVLGRETLVFAEHEATAVGCAMTAFAALGVYKSVFEALEPLRESMAPAEPDEDEADEYDDLYEEWREGYLEIMGID